MYSHCRATPGAHEGAGPAPFRVQEDEEVPYFYAICLSDTSPSPSAFDLFVCQTYIQYAANGDLLGSLHPPGVQEPDQAGGQRWSPVSPDRPLRPHFVVRPVRLSASQCSPVPGTGQKRPRFARPHASAASRRLAPQPAPPPRMGGGRPVSKRPNLYPVNGRPG